MQPALSSLTSLEALAVMVQAGLSDELVGRAAKELLSKQGRSTGIPSFGQQEQVTPPRIHGSKVPQAGTSEMSPSMHARQGETKLQTYSAKRPEMVPVKVRLPSGASNVVVPREDFQALCTKEASESRARELIRGLAKEAPEDVKNRSGWVQARVRELLKKVG